MPDGERKQDLSTNIQRERAALDDLLAPLEDLAMLAPARDDGWTAKDMLAHLTAWEERLLRWIERWRETGDPGRPDIGVTWNDIDALNESDYVAAKEKSLADVRQGASASYEAVVKALGELSDDELAAHPETADGPAWSWIIGANTHEHYREHRQEMEVWWKDNE